MVRIWWCVSGGALLDGPAYLGLEAVDVGGHDLCRPLGVAGADGEEEVPVLGDRVLEVHDPVEGEEPDAQGVHVVLVAQ